MPHQKYADVLKNALQKNFTNQTQYIIFLQIPKF